MPSCLRMGYTSKTRSETRRNKRLDPHLTSLYRCAIALAAPTITNWVGFAVEKGQWHELSSETPAGAEQSRCVCVLQRLTITTTS